MKKEQIYKDYFGNQWYEQLKDILHSDYFENLKSYLHEEKDTKDFLPKDMRLTFRAFRETPYNNVKVVIIGQDIYHDGSFDGFAFSNGTKNPKNISPSLRNIIKEVRRTYPESNTTHDLSHWARQGVFLINAGLTVIRKEPKSHISQWNPFIQEVMEKLNQKGNIVYMLWGRFAHNFNQYINQKENFVLYAGHPSPLNRSNPFIGSDHFIKANNCLKTIGEKEIVW